jgi:hypothetical protein
MGKGKPMSSKYNLGDRVFVVRQGQTEKYATCPDCAGKCYLTVIMGDDSRVTIPCTGCQRGYNNPSGSVRYYEYAAEIEVGTIGAVKIDGDTFEYEVPASGGSYWCKKESEVFATIEEAREAGKILIAEHNQQEIDNIKKKLKDHHSWAWHATYHRKCIKQAQEEIARHSTRLDWANQVKKAEKV